MDKLRLGFQLEDDSSNYDILTTLYRGDKVIGHIRMDWSNWPFPRGYFISKFIEVLDILAELGRLVQEEKWTS